MEDFVPFEIAKKLKEKGFVYDLPITYDYKNQTYQHYVEPTITQVLKWLREEKNILLAPNPACFKEDCCLSWDCDVWAYGNYNHCCVDYKTYEKASIAGIEYVINNLI